MATCIHSSRSCLLPFYTIPIFPLLNRKIFHLLVKCLYNKTSEERTLWDRGLCPLFGGCPPLGGCPFFTSKPYSVCLKCILVILWDFMLQDACKFYCDDLYKQVLQINKYRNPPAHAHRGLISAQ